MKSIRCGRYLARPKHPYQQRDDCKSLKSIFDRLITTDSTSSAAGSESDGEANSASPSSPSTTPRESDSSEFFDINVPLPLPMPPSWLGSEA